MVIISKLETRIGYYKGYLSSFKGLIHFKPLQSKLNLDRGALVIHKFTDEAVD